MSEAGRCLVLVVEDDPATAEFVESALADEGYAVRVAHSGEDALRLAEKETPALILLDLILPGISGPALLDELRRSIGAGVPVVLMTAAREPEQEKLAAAGMLLKPFDLDDLVREVARFTAERCVR